MLSVCAWGPLTRPPGAASAPVHLPPLPQECWRIPLPMTGQPCRRPRRCTAPAWTRVSRASQGCLTPGPSSPAAWQGRKGATQGSARPGRVLRPCRALGPGSTWGMDLLPAAQDPACTGHSLFRQEEASEGPAWEPQGKHDVCVCTFVYVCILCMQICVYMCVQVHVCVHVYACVCICC